MEINIDRTPWYDRPWAAFIFFTRLPFWRLHEPAKNAYCSVVEYWPLTGWFTATLMAATLWLGATVFPYPIAVLAAIVVRVLVTGALHEDGLADFCDGFGGGGTDRQRILDIMKDSRTGTYGVLGLTLYFALLYSALHALGPDVAALTIVAADPYAKMLAGQIIQMMPYARNEQEAKSHVVYRKFNTRAGLLLAAEGLLPLVPLFWVLGGRLRWELVVFVPCMVMYFLYLFVWRRLRGYTGDCCGALFLLIELSFYLTIVAQLCR